MKILKKFWGRIKSALKSMRKLLPLVLLSLIAFQLSGCATSPNHCPVAVAEIRS